MADNTTKFLRDTFMKLLEEQLEKAETQEEADEIVKKFESIDLNKIFVGMFDTMASDTTHYMRDTMHEQVMLFRADEQEFLARQEQKWCRAFVASESMYIMTLEAAEAYVEATNHLPQEELKNIIILLLLCYTYTGAHYSSFLKLSH